MLLVACGARSAPFDSADGGDARDDVPADRDAGENPDAGTSRRSCDEYCDDLQACEMGDDEACRTDCPSVRSALTDVAWDALFGDCLSDDCKTSDCQDRASETLTPSSYQIDFCDEACRVVSSCGLGMFGGGVCLDECLWLHTRVGDYPVLWLSREIVDELSECLVQQCDVVEGCYSAVIAESLPDDCLGCGA